MDKQVAEFIEAGLFVKVLAMIIALPLTLVWATELWAERTRRGKRWEATIGGCQCR